MPKITPQNPPQIIDHPPRLSFMAKPLMQEVMDRHEHLHVLVGQIESELQQANTSESGDCFTAWKLAQITSDMMGEIKSMMMLQECIEEVQS